MPSRLSALSVLSHLGMMVAVAAVMGLLVAGLAIPFAAVAGMGARTVAESMDDLPEELTAEPLAQRSRVLAADGSLLATWYDQNRITVRLDQVAPVMRKAIVAIEDYRFYEHGALDLRGTLRAFVTNQANDGVVQGGSSITQQMVKQTLVNQAKTEEEAAAATADTYARKFRELQYAIAVEEKYSKDWILERYLNVSYFGDGAYGIEAASRHYFSKPASELNLPEAALLAGLVKNPSLYDPTNNEEEAQNRRNVVLNRMADLNVISMTEAAEASAAPVKLRVSDTRNGCVGVNGEFFCDFVREYLLDHESLGEERAERERLLQAGGLTIRTTLDPRMQKGADESLEDHTNPTDQAIGGLAMVEPGTGEVKALAQSRPMGADSERGQTYLNYVVPEEYGDSAGFQAGSIFKAFVLASAIDQGVPLNTRISSPQRVEVQPDDLRTCDGPLRSNDDWRVSNSTGSGTYDLYSGTQRSVNTFFAKLEVMTGLCDPVTLARDMGVTVPESDVVGPFVLGVSSTDPLTMSAAYATFAARGDYCAPRPVTRIENAAGKVIADFPAECKRLMDTAVADAVNDILRGVQEPGGFGYSNGLALNQPSAAKTGTIQNNMAVWYVGYTPNLSTAAMLAGANAQGHWVSLNYQTVGGVSLGRAFGSSVAGPIWGDAMDVAEEYLDWVDFEEPDPTAVNGRDVSVPDLNGFQPAAAAEELRRLGLSPTIGAFVDSEQPRGNVVYTNPPSGTTRGTGSPVRVFVSDGPGQD